jgi:peptide/nickel transport system permease protein
MLRLIFHRLLWAIPLIFVVTFLTFFLNALAPGDLAQTILQGEGSPEQVDALRAEMGLDQPLMTQYTAWAGQALQGNLGASIFTGESVTHLLNSRIGVTLSIMAGVFVICLVAGVSLGILSALRGGFIGRAIDVLSLTGLVFPSFWVALVFISVFAVTLGWFPATGYTPFADSPSLWLAGLVLPVFAVALHSITSVAKQTRDSMSDVMARDFIRSLRASGLPSRTIIFKHALRNASLPLVTVMGLVMVAAISGTVFVEKVFVLPGLGSLAVEATEQFDIYLLQGVTLYFTVLTIIINLIVDLSYGWLNPKVRTQ